MPDNTAKRMTIVTASYNMEPYIEQTILSVLNQKSSDLEYILIDGASTDGTMAIAERYKSSIDKLISEPDAGQYFAIQKGFELGSGNIMGWINADDILLPWTASVVSEIFDQFPEVDWITGAPAFLNEHGQLARVQWHVPAYPRDFIANGWYRRDLGAYLQQESMFWRRSLWERSGGLDTQLKLAADFELWTRFALHTDLVPIDIPLAAFRERPDARSAAGAKEYDAEVTVTCQTKRQAPLLWRIAAGFGLVPRALVRFLIRRVGDAIIYDRRAQEWVKVRRSRSISRLTIPTLVDEWMLHWRRRYQVKR